MQATHLMDGIWGSLINFEFPIIGKNRASTDGEEEEDASPPRDRVSSFQSDNPLQNRSNDRADHPANTYDDTWERTSMQYYDGLSALELENVMDGFNTEDADLNDSNAEEINDINCDILDGSFETGDDGESEDEACDIDVDFLGRDDARRITPDKTLARPQELSKQQGDSKIRIRGLSRRDKKLVRKWSVSIRAPNGVVYCIPGNASRVMRVHTDTNEVRLIGESLGERPNKFMSAVLVAAGGNTVIYAIPYNAPRVMKITVGSGEKIEFIGPEFLSGEKWAAAAYDPLSGAIFAVPFNASQVLRIKVANAKEDVSRHTSSRITSSMWSKPRSSGVMIASWGIGAVSDHPQSDRDYVHLIGKELGLLPGKYLSCTYLSGTSCIYAVPYNASKLLRIDAGFDGQFHVQRVGEDVRGVRKWGTCVIDRFGHDSFYGIPHNSAHVLRVVSVRTPRGGVKEYASLLKFEGDGCIEARYSAGIFSMIDAHIYCVPKNASRVLCIDTMSERDRDAAFLIGPDLGDDDNKFSSAFELTSDGTIYGIPAMYSNLLWIVPMGKKVAAIGGEFTVPPTSGSKFSEAIMLGVGANTLDASYDSDLRHGQQSDHWLLSSWDPSIFLEGNEPFFYLIPSGGTDIIRYESHVSFMKNWVHSTSQHYTEADIIQFSKNMEMLNDMCTLLHHKIATEKDEVEKSVNEDRTSTMIAPNNARESGSPSKAQSGPSSSPLSRGTLRRPSMRGKSMPVSRPSSFGSTTKQIMTLRSTRSRATERMTQLRSAFDDEKTGPIDPSRQSLAPSGRAPNVSSAADYFEAESTDNTWNMVKLAASGQHVVNDWLEKVLPLDTEFVLFDSILGAAFDQACDHSSWLLVRHMLTVILSPNHLGLLHRFHASLVAVKKYTKNDDSEIRGPQSAAEELNDSASGEQTVETHELSLDKSGSRPGHSISSAQLSRGSRMEKRRKKTIIAALLSQQSGDKLDLTPTANPRLSSLLGMLLRTQHNEGEHYGHSYVFFRAEMEIFSVEILNVIRPPRQFDETTLDGEARVKVLQVRALETANVLMRYIRSDAPEHVWASILRFPAFASLFLDEVPFDGNSPDHMKYCDKLISRQLFEKDKIQDTLSLSVGTRACIESMLAFIRRDEWRHYSSHKRLRYIIEQIFRREPVSRSNLYEVDLVRAMLTDERAAVSWLRSLLSGHHIQLWEWSHFIEFMEIVSRVAPEESFDDMDGRGDLDTLSRELSRTQDPNLLVKLLQAPDVVKERVTSSRLMIRILNRKFKQPLSIMALFLDGISIGVLIPTYMVVVYRAILHRQFGADWYSYYSENLQYSHMIGVALTMILFLAIREIAQLVAMLRMKMFRVYFTDVWNWIDIAALVSATWAMAYITQRKTVDSAAFRLVTAITAIMLWGKFLGYTRVINPNFASFMIAIQQIIIRIIPFCMLLAVVMLMFAEVFVIVFEGDNDHIRFAAVDNSPWVNWGETAFTLYRMLFGDFDRDWFRTEDRDLLVNRFVVVIFVAFQFIVGIVLLNVLIAVVSDAYEV